MTPENLIKERMMFDSSNTENESLKVNSKLAQIARLQGLTQGEIARQCGISRMAVHRYFNGQSELRAKDLINVLEILGIEIRQEVNQHLRSQLAGETGKKNPALSVISSLLSKLPKQIQKTLIEQVIWWANQHGSPQEVHESIEVLKSYVNSLNRMEPSI